MGLFDDPEMQLGAFEQSGLNNAQRNSPYLNWKTGLLEKPTMEVQLPLLSGTPPSSIKWDKGGMAHQDPAMFGFTGKDSSYYSRLLPEQDPQFKNLEYNKTAQIYRDLTPEQIRGLHYTDPELFAGTVNRELNIMNRSADYAAAFLERQKAIQDFRLGNRSANNLARELENYGIGARLYEIAQHGERKNMEYAKNLRRYLQDNPEDMVTGAIYGTKGFDLSDPNTRLKILPGREDFKVPSQEVMDKRRIDARALLGEWEQLTRKNGLGTEAFTEQIANNRGPMRFNTGGFLLEGIGMAPMLGMVGRLLGGGKISSDEDGNIDVKSKSEVQDELFHRQLRQSFDPTFGPEPGDGLIW